MWYWTLWTWLAGQATSSVLQTFYSALIHFLVPRSFFFFLGHLNCYHLTDRPAEDGHPPIAGFLSRFIPSGSFFSPLFEGFSPTGESFTSYAFWGLRDNLSLFCILCKAAL